MGMFNTARVWVALAIGIVSLMSYGWADEPVNFKNMPSFKVGTLPHESSEIHAEKVRFIKKFPPSAVFVKTFFGTPLPSEVGAVVLVLRDARFA